MANTLIVSKFDCSFSNFEDIVKKVDKEKGYVFCSEVEIIKVNEHKAMLLMNYSELEKFSAMILQPDLKQWLLIITVRIKFIILNSLIK